MLSIFKFTINDLIIEDKIDKVAGFYNKFCFEGVLEEDKKCNLITDFDKCDASHFICVFDDSRSPEDDILGVISLKVEDKIVYIKDFFFLEDLSNNDKNLILKYILSNYPIKDFIIKIQVFDFSYFDKYINNKLVVIPSNTINTHALPFSSCHLYLSIPFVLTGIYHVKNLKNEHSYYPNKFNIKEYILTIKDRMFVKKGDVVIYNKDRDLSIGFISNVDLNSLKCSIIEIGNYGTKESEHQLSDVQKTIHSIDLEYLKELTPKKGMIKFRNLIDMERLKKELSMNLLEVFNKII